MLLGVGNGALVRSALQTLAYVPPEAIERAFDDISVELAIGPLLDPSAYTDGERFRNAADYRRILELVLPVCRELARLKQSVSPSPSPQGVIDGRSSEEESRPA
jgi:hypothetical protein